MITWTVFVLVMVIAAGFTVKAIMGFGSAVCRCFADPPDENILVGHCTLPIDHESDHCDLYGMAWPRREMI